MNYKIPLSVPVINGNEWRYIKDCLDTGWVASGMFVDKFEKAIREYTGAKYAISCINGTAGLQVALRLAGIKANDEAIVPTLTFIAPVNAIKYLCAEPVFMDCNDYMNIDTEKLREFCKQECVLTKNGLKNRKSGRIIKAVVPVHVFGNPCDMAGIMRIAREYNLKVIEDATESLGSYYTDGIYKNRFTGTIGDFGVYSFNGNKIITSGGGGMIVTNDKRNGDKARYLIGQAKNDAVMYIHNEIGYNYRLTNIQAALGVAQFEKLDKMIATKRRNFDIYQRGIAEIDGVEMLEEPCGTFSNHWFYALIIDRKKYGMSNLDLMKALAKKKIETRPIWYLIHKQKIYKNNQAYRVEKAVELYNRTLHLPCSTNLTKDNIERIIKAIKNNAKKH